MKKNIFITAILGILTVVLGGALIVQAQNISTGDDDHWAWNDILNYIDFLPLSTPNVEVTSQKITGYADSSVGEISLDCATTSAGSVCGTSNYGVSNDGVGNLAGWGWSDAIGWISFCGNATQHSVWNGTSWECPLNETYQVTITDGDFAGFAWNDIVGPIQFNCSDLDFTTCPPNNYKVATEWDAAPASGWLESVVFDTGVEGGAQLNSIVWRGSQPQGTQVMFQLATSDDPAGPWEDENYTWSTTQSISDNAWVNQPQAISYAAFPPARYFRYKIWLFSDPSQTSSPRVDEVIVNWSK